MVMLMLASVGEVVLDERLDRIQVNNPRRKYISLQQILSNLVVNYPNVLSSSTS